MFNQLKSYLHAICSLTSDGEWAALQECLESKIVKKGDCLLHEGEIANEIYFVNKGLLRLFYNFKDKMQTAKFFKENEFASPYESFLTRQPSEQALDALEDSELLVLNYEHLQQLYLRYPVYERLGRLVAENLFIFVCAKSKRVLQTPEEKYLDFITIYPELWQRVPQYIIASYIGITPETLSRLRKRMSRKHLDLNQEKAHAIAS